MDDSKAKYIPPTFILNPGLDSEVMNEEIFGPILPILRVKNIDEAIKIFTSKNHSLAAYVFTENEMVADKFMRTVRTGGGCINEVISHVGNPFLPFGGFGKSGFGSYHGKHSFDNMSHRLSIFQKPTSEDNMLRYPPHSPKMVKAMKSML